MQISRPGEPKAERSSRLSSLLSFFGGGKPVYPLIGFGAGKFVKGLADSALQAGDPVLAPELLSEGAQKVDLALTRLVALVCTPALTVSTGSLLDGFGLGTGLTVRAGGCGSLLCIYRAWRRIRLDGRGIIAVGEFFEGGGTDVHRVPQGPGLCARLGHADDVRHDISAHIVGAGIPDTREGPAVLHLGGRPVD